MSISIILPIFNAELYLEEAICSILSQTYRDFELICIDDGSTDNSLKILKKYIDLDDRIVIISRENRGLVATLNQAISLSKYRYIARMDADDICECHRLELQLAEMKSKKLAIIGSSYRYVDMKNNDIGHRLLPTEHRLISWMMDLGSPFCHPSVLFDSEILGKDLFYSEQHHHCEDYELWLRCRQLGYKFGNLRDLMFNYRVLPTSISRLNSSSQSSKSIGLLVSYCSFVNDYSEAEYMLFSRKQNKDYILNLKLCSRLLMQGKFFHSIFLFLYLLAK
ncbi:glycosyltransferase family 2 protein [Shewanella psychropiezotolerans]|nr:glycosyltransferase [Shewanella psychropiezotolerans]